MNIDQKIDLITQNTEEVLTDEDLKQLIKSDTPLKHYIGFEISGMVHLGTGLISMGKVADYLNAGVECTVFLADWHTFINEKLDGKWSTIKKVANDYFKEAMIASLKCFDADWEKVNFVLGSDLYQDSTHWQTLMEVSKNTTLNRVQRSVDIAGRQAGEGIDFAKLIYPPLQVADIFTLGVNIAHAGMDQRKAHVIAREVADKLDVNPLKNKKDKKIAPICIHQSMLAGLEKPPEWPIKELSREMIINMKMSKSNPRSCIFIHDSPEEIKKKIKAAFAPPKEINYNPIIDWTESLIFWGQDRVEKGLKIKRKQEHGGNRVYNDIDKLKKDYKSGKLHPLDLKHAVADWLIEKLEPARKHFQSGKPKQGLELIKNL
jgi:tyrosyl-tRNA synthetase